MGRRFGILTLLQVIMITLSCYTAVAQCDSAVNLTMKAIKSAPKVTIEGDWDLVSNAVLYEVAFTTSDTPPASGTTANINKAFGINQQPDLKTCMHVRTICNNDTSSWSTKCIITPCTMLQPLPVNISAGFMIPSVAIANWPDAGNLSIKYEYALSDDSTLPATITRTDTNTVVFPGLINDSTYCLHIRYYCSNSQSYSPWTIRCFRMSKMSTDIQGIVPENVSIYPNPAKDVLNINLPGIDAQHDIIVSDITGKVIYRNVTKEQLKTIDLSAFANGIFIVKISGGQYNLVERIIVSR